MSELGRLVQVSELRKVWEDEARDFTPWLAKEENLSLISEAIGLGDDGLELESIEQDVGPFRADILCRMTGRGTRVLIENQLERTDHRHLGQILTYAAGLDATTIIWIAARYTQEHRAALDWLNEISGDGHSFFGLEIELWKIGDSPIAPRFNVVASPNEWTREVDRRVKSSVNDLSPIKAMQRRYWTAFAQVLDAQRGGPRSAAPQPASWISHSIGKGNIFINASMHTRSHWVRGEIYLTGSDAKANFDLLLQQREQLEDSFGEPLEWQRLPDKQDCRICFVLEQADPNDETDWPRQHRWLRDVLSRLDRTFREPVRVLGTSSATLGAQ